ncbi:hypothetical protein FAES_3107 [Fibrella aestuarina BUZ 2]|uniref:Ig-like domain-containing protein n=1 Tax=Fibrella aestuarina BUZ 2 TaxID=1166018 RepID=I0KAG3_9BACT|nr:choice-of-anchor Q domain-containing protein [Fibrella aestuarina]CCH01116.1 hypothetical protein FAES_3107 [Fibrella aestuarina BUZ 2]
MNFARFPKRNAFRWVGAVGLCLLLTTLTLAQNIRYVNALASYANPASATSWATATSNLQGAINSLSATGGQVWVADGVYFPVPAPSFDRSVSFTLLNGVELYGGFPNNNPGATMSDRQPFRWRTILSGDIGAIDVVDNSYHVLTGVGLNNTAVLDGFAIAGGSADGPGTDRFGGGLYIRNSSPIVRNCRFRNNSATSGGGLNNDDKSNPLLINCAFENNRAANVGGGMANTVSNATLINCSFVNNTASAGAGLANNSNNGGSTQLTNCTFWANVGFAIGGAISNSGTVGLSNSILWNNNRGATAIGNSGTLVATYCLIENGATGYTGTNNLTATVSPFASTSGVALNGCSLAVNAANPASTTVNSPPYSATALPTTDLLGNPRFSDGRIDMGAIEYQGPSVVITSQPSGVLAACQGTTVTAAVSVSGVGPFAYQWFRNGTVVSGATSATLSVPNAQSTASGTYSLSVTGACLSVTTIPINVLVNPFSRLYIKPGGTGNGSSWNTALSDLQVGINASCPNGQVWVAAGTYRPTSGHDRTASFSLRNQVSLLGGFVGTETLLSQRPPVNPVNAQPSSSTLSGEIGDPNSLTDNSYNVVRNNTDWLDNTAVLDGFVITSGNGSSDTDFIGGGGMYNLVSNPVVQNCLFANNISNLGGGLYNSSANPVLTNCLFRANRATKAAYGGGGIYNYGGNQATMTNCVFLSNTAVGGGGGVYNTLGSSQCVGCWLQDNQAAEGGGFYQYGVPTTKFVNSVFLNNRATSNGGAIYNQYGQIQLINSTFLSNSATVGRWLSNTSEGDSNGQALVVNCLIWGHAPGSVYVSDATSTITSSYCLFDPSTNGLNSPTNLTAVGSPFASTGSVVLSANSPAINAGNPASVTTNDGLYSATSLPPTDFLGNPRIVSGQVDIGAIEYQQVIAFTVKTGSWDDPTVWSVNRVPTAADAVELRHMVSLPPSYTAQAGSLRYKATGRLKTSAESLLRIGL